MKYFILMTFFLTSCSDVSFRTKQDKDVRSNNSQEFIDVEVSVNSNSTNLVSSFDQFLVEVSGCESGHTAEATETNKKLRLLKADSGCVAKLTSLTVGGDNYKLSHPGAVDYSMNGVGGEATLTTNSVDDARSMIVKITNQLNSIITTSEKVSFSFFGSSVEDVVINRTTDSTQVAVSGYAVPYFEMISKEIYAINKNDGTVTLSFLLSCSAAPSSPSECGGVTLGNIRYLLVKDPQTSVTPDMVYGYFSDFKNKVRTAKHIEADNTLLLQNIAVVNSSESLNQNSKFILIIKNGLSYQLFKINVM